MRKKFDSKPYYCNDDNNYIKTKIKTFKDNIITIFHNKKVPEERIPSKCLLTIALDSVIKTDTQTVLEECLYKQQKQQKQKQQKNYITEELESDSDSNIESESESELDSDSIDNDE